MNTPAYDIVFSILVPAGIGTFAGTSGWGIYINSEPTTPIKCISVYTETSPPPGAYMDRSIKPHRENLVTIRTRSSDQEEAYSKAHDIEKAIISKGRFTVAATESGELDVLVYGVFMATDISFLELNDRNEAIFTQDFTVQRKEKV